MTVSRGADAAFIVAAKLIVPALVANKNSRRSGEVSNDDQRCRPTSLQTRLRAVRFLRSLGFTCAS